MARNSPLHCLTRRLRTCIPRLHIFTLGGGLLSGKVAGGSLPFPTYSLLSLGSMLALRVSSTIYAGVRREPEQRRRRRERQIGHGGPIFVLPCVCLDL